MHFAVKGEAVDIIKALQRYFGNRIDYTIKDNEGKTANDYADNEKLIVALTHIENEYGNSSDYSNNV